MTSRDTIVSEILMETKKPFEEIKDKLRSNIINGIRKSRFHTIMGCNDNVNYNYITSLPNTQTTYVHHLLMRHVYEYVSEQQLHVTILRDHEFSHITAIQVSL